MPKQFHLPEVFRFGIFELDIQAGELRKGGMKVKIQEQPLQVLLTLIGRPGNLVSREELRGKLWPDDTFVDFDHGLNAAIKRLRDALGDSADNPQLIETVPRRGYRFIAAVQGSSVTSGIASQSKSTFFSRQWAIILLSLLLTCALVLVAAWRSVRRKEVIESKVTANSSDNSVSSAAISPDGKFLAYSDNTGIYLKQIRNGETHSVPLPANFLARVDDWFPDGSHLLLAREQSSGSKTLWSISMFGGSPLQLANDASRGLVSPDGEHVAFCRGEAVIGGLLAKEEWVMRSDGTDQVKIAADKSSWVGAVAWSPDNNKIAYIKIGETTNSVEVNEWRNAKSEILFSDSRLAPALRWLPEGRLIYFLWDANDQQGPGLWTVPMHQSGKLGGLPKRVNRSSSWVTQITANHDGRVLAFLKENWVPSVYVAAFAPDGKHLLDNRRLTLDENENSPFSWTPDSKAVLFSSDRNGTQEIFKQAIDKPLAERLVTSSEQLSQPRVTPDGTEILYISAPTSAGPGTPYSIFAIPVAGGSPRLVRRDVRIQNMQCARSPSSVCLYSSSKGDTTQTFRFDVRSGKRAASSEIGPDGNWSLSPDGLQ